MQKMQKNAGNLQKICVKAPDIIMSGDISIKTAMSVFTKAKLESVTVGGDCHCVDDKNDNQIINPNQRKNYDTGKWDEKDYDDAVFRNNNK